MARKALIHKNTTLTTNNGGVISPKLPAVGTLQKGEIAVNYKNGYETLSIENDAGEVIPFASLEQTMAYTDASIVNADWNATSGKAQILNKPDIPIINAVTETYSSTAADTTTPFTASIWRVNLSDKITELYSGLTILIKVPVAGNGIYGTLLRIDGTDSSTDSSSNLYPVCANVTTMVSTRYAVGCIIPLTFDATQAGQTLYYNSASAYTTTANGTGWTKPGCWKIADFSTGDTTTGREGYYYLRPYAGQAVYRYKYLMEGADGRLYPIVTTNQTSATSVTKTPTTVGLRPWKIWYYNHTDTVSAGAAFGALRVYPELYTTTATYNFNDSTGTYAWIFLLGSYNKDTDLFTLDTGNNYYKFVRYNAAINWASSLTAGKYYILLGSSYSTTNYVLLYNVNPFYYFNGTNLIPVTTKIALDSGPVTSVNGLTGNVNLTLGDTNVIESISVNGVAQTITNKNVDITIEVPEGELSENYAISELENENLTLAAGDTFETAFSKIEKAIIDDEETVAGALNDLNERLLDINIPASVSDLTDDIGIVKSVTVNGNNYTPTDGIVDLGTISGSGTGDTNVIETIKVNGTALTPDTNKAVDITVPTTLDSISDGTTRKLSDYLPLSGGTMTGAITVAPGDGKGLLFSTTSNINVSGTTNTILGFYNGTYIIGHAAYPVKIRGTNTRPNYNGNQLALYSDIPSAVTESTVSGWGFTKNAGTITGITMNGSSKGTSGVVDLGTVLTSFTETDPTVPAWAKAANKPTYTASEVGALPDTTVIPAAPGTLNTTATTAQSTSSSEALSGNITLHKVAKTGTYNDLIGKPTIPAAQVQSDWNATSGMGVILNKPTIPTVNNATLTIQKNGTTVNTFTANASSNVTANIQVNELPTVSSSDNGKILMVVNGAWTLVNPTTIYTGTGTPSSSQGNDGDIYLQTS